MINKFIKFIKYALLLSLAIFLIEAFVPGTYTVPPLQTREDTQYWNLQTGSMIAYTLVGAKGIKKAYPIIFLQGGPGGFISNRNIKMLAPLSEDGYDIYLYDQIGSGHSDRLANINDYTAERHKKDLVEIVMKTGAEKVILIGQSWGAVLAALYIADNPEKVQKVILTGPGGIQPMHRELLNTNSPDSLNLKQPQYSNKEANEKVKNIRIRAITFWAKSFGKKLASDKETDEFQTYLNQELNKAIVCDTAKALKAESGGGFYAQVMTVRSFSEVKDPRSKLKNCKVPVLIMRGQCDNQPWGFVNEYLELFPNHQLKIIPDAGHSISVEQPQLYLKAIHEFLNQGNLEKDELEQIYTQSIAEFIKAAYKKDKTTFDTLFFGKHVYGQPDDFPNIELPETIEKTQIRLVSPEVGQKMQTERKSLVYVNMMGWVDEKQAEFLFVVFSNGAEHQYDYFINFTYDTSRNKFELNKIEFENYLPSNGQKPQRITIYKEGKYVSDK